jgi:hypothetical protein
MTRAFARRSLLGLSLAGLAAGCDNVAEPRILGDLLIVSGDYQTAKVGTQLPDPLVVKVTDDAGRGIGGVNIAWEVVVGNGTLSSARTVTESDGETSIRATPTVGGQSALTATIDEPIDGLYQVTFVMDGT